MSGILVAIPVFNERKHLRDVIEEVRAYLPDVLVVDDGSTDGTTELLQQLSRVGKVFHTENRGYGQALISAFGFAERMGFEWLITIDCDKQHEPAFIPDFLEAILNDDADIITGTRYLRKYQGNTPAPEDRRRINMTITKVLNEALGLELTDAFCGFKAYRCASMKRLTLNIPGYAMPLQLWVQAVHHGLRIREIPVRLIYNDPNRHFGGMLDDPDARLAHYLQVLAGELDGVESPTTAVQKDRVDAVGC